MFLKNLNYQKFKQYSLLLLILSIVYSSDDKTEYINQNWPINKNKQKIINSSNTNKLDCPNGIGCECLINSDCVNNNCKKHFRAGNVCTLREGDTFPHFISKDQFDEPVDIYDFGGQGKYILIEMGATWCAPCNQLAGWLTYGEEDIKSKPFWKDEYNQLYQLIKNDEIIFITILYEDEFKDTATYDTVYEWYSTYPDDNIPVLFDGEKLLHRLIKPTGIPAVTLVDENMKIINVASRGFNTSFDMLLNILSEESIKNNEKEKSE